MTSKLERVAGLAMGLGRGHLADYGAARSRHDFTQRQLMACLILRAYLKTTYRGLLDILAGHGATVVPRPIDDEGIVIAHSGGWVLEHADGHQSTRRCRRVCRRPRLS